MVGRRWRAAAAVTAVGIFAASGIAACGSPAAAPAAAGGGGVLRVVATTTQVADFARVVGGSRVSVTQLLRPNVDPHEYEASPADVAAIAGAGVVVKNGVGLEKFLDPAIAAAGFAGTVVDTSRGVRVREGNGEEEERAGDPHIWHSPLNAKIMSRNIADAFAAADPADRDIFERNYADYAGQLDRLDRDIRAQVDSVPVGQRKLVTNHDAFGYYVERYGLQFVGSIIPSFDTAAELSAKDVSALVARIRATGVRAIFSESSLPSKTAETIGREAGVRVVEGEDALYGDTLGPAGSDADTYLRMERHNTATIVDALRG
jgi:ABC-type Zn uptake system ZnuABC Zn-binding protein ZnuA